MISLNTHGITADTPKNLLLTSGALYKDLTYASNSWTGTLLGATKGGLKFTYEPTYLDIEVDGATVAVKGITKQKVGESASLEGQMTEASKGLFALAMHLEENAHTDTDYKVLTTKSSLDEDDYVDNIAYVGKRADGKAIIIILENAICVDTFELETKDNNQNTYAFKAICTADPSSNSLDKLPVKILYPVDD